MEFANANKVYRKSGGSPTIAFSVRPVNPVPDINCSYVYRQKACRLIPSKPRHEQGIFCTAEQVAEKLASLKGAA
jgi:hypothetical protein